MIQRFKERRHNNPYMPYVFFMLELTVYAELAYLIVSVLGHNIIIYALVALILAYQITKSLKRLFEVKKRIKELQNYEKFQKKAHEKILKGSAANK